MSLFLQCVLSLFDTLLRFIYVSKGPVLKAKHLKAKELLRKSSKELEEIFKGLPGIAVF